MSPEVNQYIAKAPLPQKEICEKLRKVIFKTFPKITEEMKNGVPWYEDKFYIGSFRDSVNLGFAIYKLSKEDLGDFSGKGKYMRHLKFRSLEEIDEKRIVKLMKLVDRKFVPVH